MASAMMNSDCVIEMPVAELQRSVLQIWQDSITFRPEIAEPLQGPSTMPASSTLGVEHWRITTRSPFSVRKNIHSNSNLTKDLTNLRHRIFKTKNNLTNTKIVSVYKI